MFKCVVLQALSITASQLSPFFLPSVSENYVITPSVVVIIASYFNPVLTSYTNLQDNTDNGSLSNRSGKPLSKSDVILFH